MLKGTFKTLISIGAVVLACSLPSLKAHGGESQPVFDIQQPTVIAFFPLAQGDLNDEDTNESLADFRHYASSVREPLHKAGVKLEEVYARSFRIRRGVKVITFRPAMANCGYYLAKPGKKPRIEYGVMTDSDLLEVAKAYFGVVTK